MNPSTARPQSLEIVAEAYDRNAGEYDAFIRDNPNLNRMRRKVYEHAVRHIPAGGRILDLACGTGTDAIWFAQHGFTVHGVDISGGMLERAAEKAAELGLRDKLSFEQRSYTELSGLSDRFDCTFSNFGGLNCVPDLGLVAQSVRPLLRPEASVIWAVMPPFSLWESAQALRGQFRLASRRFSGRSTVHKEGLEYPVYYYTPRQVQAAWGPDFRLEAVRGLSVLTPPATNKSFALKRAGAFELLSALDDRVAGRWPFKYWGDFTIVTLRR